MVAAARIAPGPTHAFPARSSGGAAGANPHAQSGTAWARPPVYSRTMPMARPGTNTTLLVGLGLLVALALASEPIAAARQQDGPVEAPPRADYEDPQWADAFDGYYAFTQPSKDAQMGFNQPNEIREVLVRTGDRVSKGQVLVRARSADARENLRLQRRRAENRFEIDAAENALQLAEIEMNAQEQIRNEGGGTPREYERARTNLDAARIELEAAKERFIEQGIILARLEADFERFAVTAQFDGTVAAVEVVSGQAVQDSEPVVRLVAIDPLHVRVPTPTAAVLSLGLERGDPAWAAINVAGEPRLVEGTIAEVSPVADFAADKVWVKVQIPNPDRLIAGLQAWVRFRQPTEDFARILEERTKGQPQDGRRDDSPRASADGIDDADDADEADTAG